MLDAFLAVENIIKLQYYASIVMLVSDQTTHDQCNYIQESVNEMRFKKKRRGEN